MLCVCVCACVCMCVLFRYGFKVQAPHSLHFIWGQKSVHPPPRSSAAAYCTFTELQFVEDIRAVAACGQPRACCKKLVRVTTNYTLYDDSPADMSHVASVTVSFTTQRHSTCPSAGKRQSMHDCGSTLSTPQLDCVKSLRHGSKSRSRACVDGGITGAAGR